MMTELEICNWALRKIGEEPVETLEDNSSRALSCKAQLQPLHSSLLRRFDWSFATFCYYLSPLEQEDDGQWIYPLPRDCLRILKPQNPLLRGLMLYSSMEEFLVLTFIKKVKIEDCDPLYCEVLACKLALEVCVQARENEGLKNSLIRDFEVAWDNAVLSSSKERQGEPIYYD
ncbi:hypothetical protein CD16_05415 [Candidatus Liberibacter asiaticus]|nr:hypothetical protein CD16_05415 [Candidatus Liberibacter asiaticus]UCZ51375.1 hypothetical protein GE519_05485 [Candidatus Liberibacter asiaticus]